MSVYHQLKAEVQRRIRDVKNNWWVEKAREIQGHAGQHDMRNFSQATKTIYGPCSIRQIPVRSQDGSWLLKDDATHQRWKKHFQLLSIRSPPDWRRLSKPSCNALWRIPSAIHQPLGS